MKDANCRAPYESDADPDDYIEWVKKMQLADNEKVQTQLQNFSEVLHKMGLNITGEGTQVLRHAEDNVKAIMRKLKNQKTGLFSDEVAEILKSLSASMETEDTNKKKKRDECLDSIDWNLRRAYATNESSTQSGRSATYELMKTVLDSLLEAQQMRVKYLQDGKSEKEATETIHTKFDDEIAQIRKKKTNDSRKG